MPLPVVKHYTSPIGMPLRWNGPLLAADVWPAVSDANGVLAVARRQAEEITRSAEAQAVEILNAVQTQAGLEATQACLVAQREVWQGVLQVWLSFVEGVHSQRAEALDFALQAAKAVVGRLKLDASIEQQMASSLSLVLEHNMHTAAGELRVCAEDVPAVHAVLSRWGRSDMVVVPDPAMSSGTCVLRCDKTSFETQFGNNVQVMLDALEQIASSV